MGSKYNKYAYFVELCRLENHVTHRMNFIRGQRGSGPEVAEQKNILFLKLPVNYLLRKEIPCSNE